MDDAQDPPTDAQRSSYHHGYLRDALIEAAVQLAEEIGPEQVTMREAARRAGVSSAAPFRHFPTKKALMTAVAENAMRRMQAEIEANVAAAAGGDAMVRFRAFGRGYLQFVVRWPTYFRILSDRRLLDWSSELQAGSAALQGQMRDLLTEAADQGLLGKADLAAALLDARAVSYGIARTYVDGQMSTWGVPDAESVEAMYAVLDRYVDRLGPRG